VDDDMSSEQSLDPQLIEQTKQQIRMLVNEISQLAKSGIAPEEFYGEFLPRVVSALAAVGGAVWVVQDQGQLTLGYQMNLQQSRLGESEDNQIRHGRLLRRVLLTGEGALVPPHTGAADEQGANPTDFLLVLAPLKAAEDTVGVVEVFQRANTRPATQKGYLRFLLEMCDRAGEFFKTHQLRHFTDRQVLWTQLEDFARNIHASLDPRDAAYTIANDGRRLIECDRVSVAIRKGRRCHVEAVSGQDLFDKRSNTVRLLGRLATVVAASEEPVWYTGDTSDFPPQVEDAMQEYVDESHSKTVAVLPLRRPLPPGEEEEDPDKRREPEPPIGALIVEQIEDARLSQRMVQRVDVVCQHSSTALANALEHNNLFLMPLWRTLGKARWIVKGRTLPKTVVITALVVAVLLSLVFVPWPWGFTVQAKGKLEPVEQREVFAQINGVIEEVFVEHRDVVHGPRPVVDEETSADTQEVRATIREDPSTDDVMDCLLTVPRGNALFQTNGVTPGDVVRVLFTVDAFGEESYTELTVREVLDENTLRLESGPAEPIHSPRRIEVWRRGTLLVRLENTELEIKIKEVLGKLAAVDKRIRSVRDDLSEASRQRDFRQELRLEGDLTVAETEKQSLLEQKRLYEVQARQLEVRAPASGQVVTWDVEKMLPVRRPVNRGDVLMRVANPEGPWELEVLMPDKRMGHVVRSQKEAEEKGEALEAQFILATDPDTPHVGNVKEIGESAEPRGDEGNTVPIKVEITEEVKQRLPQPLRPGAEVTARVKCGSRPIGYVLFHDLIAFFQSKILFRWF
jgi:hypothetical protein